jgi:hypothetical protein
LIVLADIARNLFELPACQFKLTYSNLIAGLVPAIQNTSDVSDQVGRHFGRP